MNDNTLKQISEIEKEIFTLARLERDFRRQPGNGRTEHQIAKIARRINRAEAEIDRQIEAERPNGQLVRFFGIEEVVHV
jgi:hypothetical protein